MATKAGDGARHPVDGARLYLSFVLVVAMVALALLGTPPAKAAHVDPAQVTTIPVGDGPLGVAVNDVTNRVYVSNPFEDTVSVIDSETNTVVASIPVGNEPWGVAVNPETNRIYVANAEGGSSFGASVSVIDGATNTVIATIPISDWSVRGIAVNPATDHVYVAGCCARVLRVIDGATNQLLPAISLPRRPHPSVAVNTAINRIYAADARVDDGHVYVVDGATNSFLTAIPMPEGAVSSPFDITVNEATNRIYGAQFFDDTVAVIDGATSTLDTVIPVGSSPIAAGVNSDTNRVYIANLSDDDVSVINGSTDSVVSAVPAGDGPRGVDVSVEDDAVYVTNLFDDTVSVIADCTDTEPPVLDVSLTPDVLSPPDRTMRTIGADITVSDDCDASPTVRLSSISASGPDIPNPPQGALAGDDVQGASLGADDREFDLRAEIDGDGTSRTYTVTYEAEDASGKTSTTSQEVAVPVQDADPTS